MTLIDLVADELLLLEGTDDQVADFLRSRSPGLTLLELARDGAFPSVVVPGSIEGFEEISTMLDTGGKGTEFSSAAVPGLVAAASARLGGGVSGADYAGGSVGPRTLLVNGHALPVPALLVRERMHDPQGIVGMDVLRGTVLSCATDVSRFVFWQIRGDQFVGAERA